LRVVFETIGNIFLNDLSSIKSNFKQKMDSVTMEDIAHGRNSRSPKRKSSDNDENQNLNTLNVENETAVPKKAKTSISLSENATFSTDLSNNAPRTTKSALPRFSSKRVASITPKAKPETAPTREKVAVQSAAKSNPPPTTPAKTVTTATNERGTEKKAQAQQALSIADPVNTIIAQGGPVTPRISANPFLKKVQRELINEVTGHFFNNLHEQYISSLQTEDKIQVALASLKVKNKWDAKEKLKKQEGVLKEFRDVIVHLQDGINQMKNQASNFEVKIQSGLREVYDQLVDNIQIIASLQSNERKLKKEHETLTFENKSLLTRMDSTKSESQQQIRQIEMSLMLQKQEKERFIEKINDLEGQLKKLNKVHDETVEQFRTNSAQVKSYISGSSNNSKFLFLDFNSKTRKKPKSINWKFKD
jgi:hypothetical protein